MEQEERIAPGEWQTSLATEPSQADGKTMSLGQTLVGIFFEPARTFEALRVKPRFLVAALICMLAFMAFQIGFIQKLGYENIVQQQLNNNPRAEQLSAEQKAQTIAFYNSAPMKAFFYAGAPIIGTLLVFAIGALIYWGASAAFGGSASFLQSLSLLVYASMPVYVITMLLNIVVLLLKPASEIDPVAAQRGLLSANLGILVNPKAFPLLATVLNSFDLFVFYGMFLAALGFQKVARLSPGLSWAIVIILWAINVVFRIAGALMSGAAM